MLTRLRETAHKTVATDSSCALPPSGGGSVSPPLESRLVLCLAFPNRMGRKWHNTPLTLKRPTSVCLCSTNPEPLCKGAQLSSQRHHPGGQVTAFQQPPSELRAVQGGCLGLPHPGCAPSQVQPNGWPRLLPWAAAELPRWVQTTESCWECQKIHQ